MTGFPAFQAVRSCTPASGLPALSCPISLCVAFATCIVDVLIPMQRFFLHALAALSCSLPGQCSSIVNTAALADFSSAYSAVYTSKPFPAIKSFSTFCRQQGAGRQLCCCSRVPMTGVAQGGAQAAG